MNSIFVIKTFLRIQFALTFSTAGTLAIVSELLYCVRYLANAIIKKNNKKQKKTTGATLQWVSRHNIIRLNDEITTGKGKSKLNVYKSIHDPV